MHIVDDSVACSATYNDPLCADAKQSSGNAHSSSTLQRLNTIEKECTVRLESSKESQT